MVVLNFPIATDIRRMLIDIGQMLIAFRRMLIDIGRIVIAFRLLLIDIGRLLIAFQHFSGSMQ